MNPVLEVRDLTTVFHGPTMDAAALNGVSFTLDAGRTLGIVGESGGGKSVLVRSLMGLHSDQANATVTGSSLLNGRDLLAATPKERRRSWGRDIAMIFQNPMTSLNPVRRIGTQLKAAIRLHHDLPSREVDERALHLLDRVRIADPRRRLRQYPHELSGGMRQRVCIALALAANPSVLLADEPTTALDVTVQHQILDLLGELAEQSEMATVLITHDLGVVARQAHEIAVLYAGRIVEYGPTAHVLGNPRHPYTLGLVRATPRLAAPSGTTLSTLGGHPPSPLHRPAGCAFAPRCDRATEGCHSSRPALEPIERTSPPQANGTSDPSTHLLACFNPVPIHVPKVAS